MIRISQSAGVFPVIFNAYTPAAGKRWRVHVMQLVRALGAGAGTVPFGDNGDVFRALAESRAQSDLNARASDPQHERVST
jgi:hypothetical protein